MWNDIGRKRRQPSEHDQVSGTHFYVKRYAGIDGDSASFICRVKGIQKTMIESDATEAY